ncbi:MAG: ferritin-like domain-containing protein [Bacteroidia bacterium]|nr:ferritin-like domain-containing protein [Bacteroidia bacterium]
MKKSLLSLIILGVFSIFGFGQTKPVKSIEGLKAAYNGESTASAKYAKFAEASKKEGLNNIAKMFMATSKAETVHAGNHKKVLIKLGETVGDPEIGKFEVKTTAENLVDASKGETYEMTTMYPDFIKSAVTEKENGAKKSFTWAMDTEKKHNSFYKKALEAVKAGTEKSFPGEWYVCPVCGNTYNVNSVKGVCDFCQTPKAKFVVFK